MAASALPIHSLAEAYLYLMVTPCEACGAGPMTAEEHRVHHDADHRILTVPVTCRKCGWSGELRFDTSRVDASVLVQPAAGRVATINPTDEPSRIIDVAGWVTLATVITDAATRTSNRTEARELKMEAGRCLDEALKFYDADNDLPPAEALFNERSRERFRRNPAGFSREKLVSLRTMLPIAHTAPVDEAGESGADSPDDVTSKPRRRWWPWH